MQVFGISAMKSYKDNVVPVSVDNTRNLKPSFGYIPNKEQVAMLKTLPPGHRKAWSDWIRRTAIGASGTPSDVVMDVEVIWARVRVRAKELFPQNVIAFWDREVLGALCSDSDGILRVNNISRKLLDNVFNARKYNHDETFIGNA